jgi:hypothetical protein
MIRGKLATHLIQGAVAAFRERIVINNILECHDFAMTSERSGIAPKLII